MFRNQRLNFPRCIKYPNSFALSVVLLWSLAGVLAAACTLRNYLRSSFDVFAPHSNTRMGYTLAVSEDVSAVIPAAHPVLVEDIGDDHQLAILLAVVDHSHTADLHIALERHFPKCSLGDKLHRRCLSGKRKVIV